MALSNSKLTCYSNCQRKYLHAYILNTVPCLPPSPHLGFGTMAHEVLQKAGQLRDESNDGVVSNDDYYTVIPSEVSYPQYKEFFGINSWTNYFTAVIKQTSEHEFALINLLLNGTNNISIHREVKFKLSRDETRGFGYVIEDGINGIIDLLIVSDDGHAIIIDYKFTTKNKTQDDFDMDSQLQLYAFAVHKKYNIELRNIQIGYISIPKTEFERPALLKSGCLSVSKSQNVSCEAYKEAVEAIHGNDPVYNCKPGGHYYDAYCNFALNKSAYLQTQYLDMETYIGVNTDLMLTANDLQNKKDAYDLFLAKYDSYSCAGCEYVNTCKPWIKRQN